MARYSLTSVRVQNDAAIKRIRARLEGVSEANLRKGAARALVSTRRRFEVEAKRAIRATHNVPLKELAGAFQVQAGSDATGEYLELSASTRKIPLIAFGARWGGRRTAGATAQILRGGPRTTIRSAFINPIRGVREVLIRQLRNDGSGKRDPRNKLRRLRGPSPDDMLRGGGGATATRLAGEMRGYLDGELDRQIQLAMRGRL